MVVFPYLGPTEFLLLMRKCSHTLCSLYEEEQEEFYMPCGQFQGG